MRCEDCHDLLLDHLNGLLDPPEAAALEDHLSGCPACAAALAGATRVQSLFARAAKLPFPDVRFVPPADAADRNGEEKAVPSTVVVGAKPVRAAWSRWAVAAAVLVGTVATVAPVADRVTRYDTARREADRAAAVYTAARSTLTRAQDEGRQIAEQKADRPLQDALAALDRLKAERARQLAAAETALAQARAKQDRALAAWVAAEKAAAAADKDRTLTVGVTHPYNLRPGTANDIVIDVADRGPTARTIEAVVRDATGTVVRRQELTPTKPGQPAKLHLPAAVWANLSPQSELFLAVDAVDPSTGRRTPAMEPVRLFGPEYSTLLTTDKPDYRPGERLFFRSLTLDRVTFRPPAREQHLRFELRSARPPLELVARTTGLASPVRVTDGAVEPVRGPDGKPVRGTGCGEFVLPTTLAEGEYVLVLTEASTPAGEPATVPTPVTRTVRVRTGAADRFHKKLWFAAASFGPGQEVTAFVELTQNGKPVAGARVFPAATADGKTRDAQPVDPVTDAAGRAVVKVELPPALPRGDVRLRVTFEVQENGKTVTESVAERVPVAGPDVAVEFFPEGGKLVAGVPNRVYVRATTRDGRPADVRGALTDGREALARIETVTDPTEPGANRGIGSFVFTPETGRTYAFTPDRPTGGLAAALAAAVRYRLPKVEADGVAMTVLDPVAKPGQPVRVRLYSVGAERRLVVGAYVRGRLADTKAVTVPAGGPVDVPLLAGADPRGGVVRITVFEQAADLTPRAERLVYRTPAERLDLGFAANGGPLTPGSPVELTLTAADETGNPVPAIVWVSAVNSAVAEGPRDRLMPTHFLLAGEVESPDALEQADFLLTDHPKAADALDRVLATQGWRTFAEKPAVVRETATDRGLRKRAEAFWPGYVAAADELAAARQAKDAVLAADPARLAEARALAAAAEREWKEWPARAAAVEKAADTPALAAAAEAARANAAARAEETAAAAGSADRVRSWAWPAAAACGLLAVGLIGVGAVRAGRAGVFPLAVAALAATGLAAYLGSVAAREFPRPQEPAELAAATRPAPPPMPRGLTPADWTHEPRTGQRPKNLDWVADERPGPIVRPDAAVELTGSTLQPRARRSAATVEAVRAEIDVIRRASDAATGYAADRITALRQAVEADPALAKRVRSAIPVAKPLVVREYAAPRPGTPDAGPADADTVLWQPLLVLPADGKATIRFHAGAAPGYRVIVAGHTLDGRLGAVRGVLPVGAK